MREGQGTGDDGLDEYGVDSDAGHGGHLLSGVGRCRAGIGPPPGTGARRGVQASGAVPEPRQLRQMPSCWPTGRRLRPTRTVAATIPDPSHGEQTTGAGGVFFGGLVVRRVAMAVVPSGSGHGRVGTRREAVTPTGLIGRGVSRLPGEA